MRRTAEKIRVLTTILSGRLGVSPQFLRFLVVGGVNTGTTYLLYLLLLWLGASPLTAYNTSFVFGVFLSYVLNVKVTFQTKHSSRKLLSFPLVYVVQYAVGLLVLKVGLHFGLPAEFAAIPVVLINLPVTFLMSRLLLR